MFDRFSGDTDKTQGDRSLDPLWLTATIVVQRNHRIAFKP